MSRIARAAVLILVAAGALGLPGCESPPWRSHPWRPPGTRLPIHTWTTTYGEFPPSIDRPHVPQGQPSDG